MNDLIEHLNNLSAAEPPDEPAPDPAHWLAEAQALASPMNIGERVDLSVNMKTAAEVASLAGVEDAIGDAMADYLMVAHQGLSARLRHVETAMARLVRAARLAHAARLEHGEGLAPGDTGGAP